MKMRVLIGMSGGIDSSVAAYLLLKSGYEVEGITLRLWGDAGEDEKDWKSRSCCKIGIARYVAEKLGIKHSVVDISNQFKEEIIGQFLAEYTLGRTPNPCVRCNERIKFGLLFNHAREKGFDLLATGHYARIEKTDNGKYLLKKGADETKDQGYFLYRLKNGQLKQILFPLGDITKKEVFNIAEECLGLPVEEIRESQEICFVTQKDYRDFVMGEIPQAAMPGDMVSVGGDYLGRHRGIAFYTVGQRRGLGIPAQKRLYVVRIEKENNRVVLGDEKDLYVNQFVIKDINLIGADNIDEIGERKDLKIKIRYRSDEVSADILPAGDNRALVILSEGQRGVAPGQSAVIYDGEYIVGGGVIEN
jgi:tRNA-specific 2-thiouridylase